MAEKNRFEAEGGIQFIPAHTIEYVPVTGRHGEKIMQVRKVTEIPQPKRNPKLGDNNKPHNPVSNPAHYTADGVSPIEFISAQLGISGLRGFCLGNTFKYLARAGKKDPHKEIEDLEKGLWYLEYYIEELKMRREQPNG